MQLLSCVPLLRRVSAYVVWLTMAYLPIAWGLGSADASERLLHPKWLLIWLIFVPVGIALVQIIRPTFVGWMFVFVPTLLYSICNIYRVVHYTMTAQHWGFHDSEDAQIALLIYGAELFTCAVLLLVRPESRFYFVNDKRS